ncbi:DUF3040 domain-containing protein [Brevibacterium sp. 50QC2O2]|jgi:protein-S-isoprenylcysteine O-methyltransferase Ste14|uniref:DUF3040 domain-containing protein n=1 Tax=Brevibacterium TaxID=1696 RepID=UPI00211CB883|nr:MULTISPECIES: DUF3040 domain-containing protein [unclassified Brevibacterium]MCQ9367033.1 DUF3040 domain-containing protein [Brevibacterium sp. 91QC2O2]MCQ9384182.1 DUF3040 domain-containing protein [Brevibacterium sp. 68QC2CO]MCQ9388340.1 DUF3040 domain-containing protein [Brevibacterium sp. 50QC2O2]
MPLSDHEQELLDELEKQLYREDPRFVQHISAAPKEAGGSLSAKHFVAGVLVLVAGVAIAVGSLFSLPAPWNVVVGVLGFAIMVFGGYWAVTGTKRGPAQTTGSGASKPAKPAGSAGGFMKNMEDRWDKRQER